MDDYMVPYHELYAQCACVCFANSASTHFSFGLFLKEKEPFHWLDLRIPHR